MSEDCAPLREEAAACDAYSTADVTRLRKKWDKELVHAALALAKARAKAASKFGSIAAGLVADVQGVEMASSRAAAAWKARRFAAAGRRVLDLCCGIGGDAMALAAAGLDVVAVDADPVRAWMAGLNARCSSLNMSIEQLLTSGDGPTDAAFHIDPSRRMKDGSTSKRVWTLGEVQPPPPVLRAVVERWKDGAIKLAPGISYSELSQAQLEGEVEIISERGGLTQAVLWTGDLARGPGLRTATLLPCVPSEAASDAPTLSGPPDDPAALPVWDREAAPRFIHEVDDSVERAELLTVLCTQVGAAMLHPKLGLIAADHAIEHPMLRPFEMLEAGKWNEQRAASVLQRLGAGSVEVKTRAKAVHPDEVQPAMTKVCAKGGRPLVLFVLRFGSEARMLIASRVR